MKQLDFVQKVEELGKTVLSTRDIQQLFPEEQYVKMSIDRLKKHGTILPIARGYYVLRNVPFDVEKVASQIYYPSYVSFETALSKYGIINQGPYTVFFATTRHAKNITIAGTECSFNQLKKSLFFGFQLLQDVYIADPEKAVLDMLYLISMGKRVVSTDEWDLSGLDKEKTLEYAKKFPKKVEIMIGRMLLKKRNK